MIAVTQQTANDPRGQWLKRLGVAGFWFFFIKGLLWLAAPLVFYLAT